MKKSDEDVNRRDFGKLALAAFSGVLAASALGSSIVSADSKRAAAAPDTHACCGLNKCKGQGASGKNACAGQGTCATSGAAPLTGDAWKQARARYEAAMRKAGKKYGVAPSNCGAG